MTDAINGWDSFHRQQFQESRAAFEARADYMELVAEATRLGLRRITLSEQMDPGSADAYLWRGGVWIKSQPTTGEQA